MVSRPFMSNRELGTAAKSGIQEVRDHLWNLRNAVNAVWKGLKDEVGVPDLDVEWFNDGGQSTGRDEFFKTLKKNTDDLVARIDPKWFNDKTVYNELKKLCAEIVSDVTWLTAHKPLDFQNIEDFVKRLRSNADALQKATKIVDQWARSGPREHAPKEDEEEGMPEVPKPKGAWKDQLQKVALKLLQGEEDTSNNKKIITIDEDSISADHINELAKQKPRLLKADEPFGVCEAPTIHVKWYITKRGAGYLQNNWGLKLEYIHTEYLLIKNTVMLGISEKLVAESGMQPLDLFAEARDTLAELGNDKLKGAELFGPMRKKGSHFYVIAMPGDMARQGNIALYQWDFSKGVAQGQVEESDPTDLE